MLGCASYFEVHSFLSGDFDKVHCGNRYRAISDKLCDFERWGY